jgi:alpha-1,3-rhamnosyltransferase
MHTEEDDSSGLMERGKVSVIIPSYNHARYVKETIEGVWNQTYRPVELVVVDDASTDESPEILKALQSESPIPFELELLEENQGALVFNQALALCSGEYLAVCASDDVLFPKAMEKLTEVLEADDRVQVVFGNGWSLADGKLRKESLYQAETAEVLEGPSEGVLQFLDTRLNPFWIQSSLMRTSLVRAIGGQTEDLRANDGDFLRRIFAHLVDHGTTHAFVDMPIFVYRLHEENMHKDPVRMREAIDYAVETQLGSADKSKVYHESLTKMMRFSLDANDPKEAVRTLSFLLDKMEDEELVQFYRKRLRALAKELEKAHRDPETGEWVSDLRKAKRGVAAKIGRFWTKSFRFLSGRG